MKQIIPLLFLVGCVVPYGEAPETSAVTVAPAVSTMGDLTSLEARLLLLLDENQDADRAARLEALRSLMRRSRTWTPDAQRDLVVYLEALLRVEERWRGEQGLEGFEPIASAETVGEPALIQEGGAPVAVPIVEERLGEELQPADTELPDPGPAGTEEPSLQPAEPVAQPEQAGEPEQVTPDRDPDARRREGLERAREALSKDAYLDALAELDALLEAQREAGVEELDEELMGLRQEAVDGWVHIENERAGEMFLAARALQDADARRAAFEAVAALLESLQNDYPDAALAQRISRNLRLVHDELRGE